MNYKVSLESFEGPLDLLLHLIKKEEVDIYDIPIAHILDQYMDYIRLMELLDMNVAGEFLVMASTLMLIKSKMLLPPDPFAEEEEEDPREKLVQQLLEYQRFKEVTEFFQECEDSQKKVFYRGHRDEALLGDKEVFCTIGLFDLLNAFKNVLENQVEPFVHEIIKEEVTVEDCVADMIEAFKVKAEYSMKELFKDIRSKIHLICSFLATLEMIKQKEIEVFKTNLNEEFFFKKTSHLSALSIDNENKGNKASFVIEDGER